MGMDESRPLASYQRRRAHKEVPRSLQKPRRSSNARAELTGVLHKLVESHRKKQRRKTKVGAEYERSARFARKPPPVTSEKLKPLLLDNNIRKVENPSATNSEKRTQS